VLSRWHDEDHRGAVAPNHTEDQASDTGDPVEGDKVRESEAGATRQHWPSEPGSSEAAAPKSELKRAAVVLWGAAKRPTSQAPSVTRARLGLLGFKNK
jgi:hypothetical protein